MGRQYQLIHGNDVSEQDQSLVNQPYSRQSRLPSVLEHSQNDTSAHISLLIEETNPAFAGHFPDHPVVPGLVQIEWADYFCRSLAVAGQLKNLEAVKFTRLMKPGSTVQLKLEIISAGSGLTKVQYTYFDDDSSYSSGKLVYVD